LIDDVNPFEPDELESQSPSISRFSNLWEAISRAGLAEEVFRLGTHALLVALILLVAWGLSLLYSFSQVAGPSATAIMVVQQTPAPDENSAEINTSDLGHAALGISRLAELHTEARTQPRTTVITYTLKAGDTIFGVAEMYGLKPETILLANQSSLGDNPDNIRIGQVLTILPVDGIYHRWSAGDDLNDVAKFFGVTPADIIDFPGNQLSIETVGDWVNPKIAPGTWLVIPGGQRQFTNWSAPDIPLDDPKVASILGPGSCDKIPQGAIGIGSFVWPVIDHSVSGYGFEPGANHPALDIDGDEGDPVYATDNGVVVYAGWNDWGYGNLIVINHGNGWQTLYSHLSAIYVSCGQSIWQSNTIGAIGATGNASLPHLHFEMSYNAVKLNPLDYLLH
jgi:murein DD-endopeptidase MepM/ murein hydrolase activator NlpD